MRKFGYIVFVFFHLLTVQAISSPFRCGDLLGELGGVRYATDERGSGGTTSHRPNRFDTVEHRLRFLLSVLQAHPNIVSSNLQFRRNILDLLAHMPDLAGRLGTHLGPISFSSSTHLSLAYEPSVARYNDRAVQRFLEDRVGDLQGLDLLPRGNLGQQLTHIFDSSHVEGVLNERMFENRLKKLYRLLPFLFDAEGRSLFPGDLPSTMDLAQQIRGKSISDLQNGYGDLVTQHLAPLIRDHARTFSRPRLQEIFSQVQDRFIRREVLQRTLRPVNEESLGETRELSLERLPHDVSLLRGCYGGDCSINSVPFYSLLREARSYFIRSGSDPESQPIGYVFTVLVDVPGRGRLPYIITINGRELSKSDSDMVIRMVARDYGTSEVVVPDFRGERNQNWNLVNSDAPRDAMMSHSGTAVNITLPGSWEIVDGYIREKNGQDFTNYYHGSRIGRGFILSVPGTETRVRRDVATQELPSRYRNIENASTLPELERAILAAQVLSDEQGHSYSRQQVLDFLSVSTHQANAARPLLQVSEDRPLTATEYRALSTHLGFSLMDILNFKKEVRAQTLKKLYEDDPSLFAEHRHQGNGRYLEALSIAYSRSGRAAELIRSVLEASDINDNHAINILRKLDSAFHWDATALNETLAMVRGKGIEEAFRNQFVSSLWEFAYADSATGQRLLQLLSQPQTRGFAETLLQRIPSTHRLSGLAVAIQEVHTLSKESSISFDQALVRWLASPDVPEAKKATLLRIYLNRPNFSELLNHIPQAQRPGVQNRIHRYSNIDVFRTIADGQQITTGGWFRRRVVTPNPNAGVMEQARLESFEFRPITVPEGGITTQLGEPGNAQREVTLTRQFEVGNTQVTQLQWALVMGETPSRFKDGEGSIEVVVNGTRIRVQPNRPVEQVSWNDVQRFITRMNKLDPTHTYRLPTEAEWEYVARGGSDTRFSFGSSAADLPLYGWFDGNSGNRTHDVAGRRPNPFGLFDAHGNVWEWVQDWYTGSPTGGVDPRGPDSGDRRVMRGGSWFLDALFARSAYRNFYSPEDADDFLGFRLVRTPK